MGLTSSSQVCHSIQFLDIVLDTDFSLFYGNPFRVLIFKQKTQIKGIKNRSILPAALQNGCGGRIRTDNLRVMSPTSYQTAPPRDDN
jgi:hypothetical protein